MLSGSISYGQTVGVNDLLEMKAIKDKVSPGSLFNYLDKKGLETGQAFKDSTGVSFGTHIVSPPL
ncbi:MAG: hypothetical protein EOP48_06395 [Sphingobacteriales bacterium]|nr:MAG: hypothetical protein EOP48_06395 [Sphingobacteriales bacterium]